MSRVKFDQDTNIRLVARSMIGRFGGTAMKVVRDRIDDAVMAGEEQGVSFWRSVERATRSILHRELRARL